MKLIRAFFVFAVSVAAAAKPFSEPTTVPRNHVAELELRSTTTYPDPFNDIELDVIIKAPSGSEFRVPAFWAGSNTWRVRVSAPEEGRYALRTVCSDPRNASLHHQQSTLVVTRYMGTNTLFQHGPIKVSADKRHFEHRDGTPFLWFADTWWMGFTRRLHEDEFQRLATDRVAKGFNAVQIVAGLYPDMPAFDERGLGEAGFPWTTNYSRIRPEYFDAADKRIAHLVENGLMPCIVGAWAYHLPWLGVERMKKHWRYLVARWGAWPVVWCVAGEGAMPYYLSDNKDRDRGLQIKGWTEIAHFLHQTDGYGRLVTIHPTDYSRAQVDDASVLDFEMLQTGHGDRGSIPNTIDTLRRSLRLEPAMPVINSEVCYEGIGGTCFDDVQRFYYWACMLSGAAGHTYGANGIWQVNRREQPYGKSPHGGNWGTTPWDDAMQLPGSGQLGRAKALLARFDWWRFETHPEWAAWDTNTPLPQITWGDWIWFPEGNPAKDAPAETRYFRRTFGVPAGQVSRATLRLAVDDKLIAYLNGERLGSHNTWRTIREFNITGRLQAGKNVLAVRAENSPVDHANPAGLLCQLEIVHADKRINILSDVAWRVTNTERAGWTNLAFNDGSWSHAKVVAKYGDPPWDKLPDPTHRNYTVPYAAGIPGKVRVIYLPRAHPTIVRDLERDATYSARWFDPITGAEHVIGQLTLDAGGDWAAPPPPRADQDWVLLLHRR